MPPPNSNSPDPGSEGLVSFDVTVSLPGVLTQPLQFVHVSLRMERLQDMFPWGGIVTIEQLDGASVNTLQELYQFSMNAYLGTHSTDEIYDGIFSFEGDVLVDLSTGSNFSVSRTANRQPPDATVEVREAVYFPPRP